MTTTTHKVWRLGADIDTDQLAPGSYMKLGANEIAPHCLEAVRPEFAGAVRPGDVIAAGPIFGIGSSREQAAAVLATVHRDADTWTPEQAEAFKAPVRQKYEDEGNPYYATARLWDDGMLLPVETRDVLGLAFAVCLNAPIEDTRFGVFRM